MEHIEVKISDISLTNVGFAVFLKPEGMEDDKRVVPIFIGPLETHSITTILDGTKSPRPMTHDLMLYMLTSMHAKVQKITIDEIKDNTFYAKIYINQNGENIVMDARPSDSIALALRANAPIYISNAILEEAGIAMKEEDIPGDSLSTEKIQKLPKTQLEILQDTLNNAVASEDYETAAKIRDQIKKLIENS